MLVFGMMSGTSADGIDVALARISGAPPNLNAKLVGHTSEKFPPALRREILRIAEQQSILCRRAQPAQFRLGELFADAALSACRTFRMPPSRIALIGSHGQTIFHQGRPVPYFGRQPLRRFRSVSHPSLPRAWHHHRRRFSPRRHRTWRPGRAARSIGRLPSVWPPEIRPRLTQSRRHRQHYRPSSSRQAQQVFAFDTGDRRTCSSTLSSLLIYHARPPPLRRKRALRRTRPQHPPRLLNELLRDSYLKLPPPKSTGREYYGHAYVKKVSLWAAAIAPGPTILSVPRRSSPHSRL